MGWIRIMRSKGLNAGIAAVLSFSLGLPPAWALQSATMLPPAAIEEGWSTNEMAAHQLFNSEPALKQHLAALTAGIAAQEGNAPHILVQLSAARFPFLQHLATVADGQPLDPKNENIRALLIVLAQAIEVNRQEKLRNGSFQIEIELQGINETRAAQLTQAVNQLLATHLAPKGIQLPPSSETIVRVVPAQKTRNRKGNLYGLIKDLAAAHANNDKPFLTAAEVASQEVSGLGLSTISREQHATARSEKGLNLVEVKSIRRTGIRGRPPRELGLVDWLQAIYDADSTLFEANLNPNRNSAVSALDRFELDLNPGRIEEARAQVNQALTTVVEELGRRIGTAADNDGRALAALQQVAAQHDYPQLRDLAHGYLSIAAAARARAAGLEQLAANLEAGVFDQADIAIIDRLIAMEQAHLFVQWDGPGTNDELKRGLLEQVRYWDRTYPGGTEAYYQKGLELFGPNAAQGNPLTGKQVNAPPGSRIDTMQQLQGLQDKGLRTMNLTSKVLVAGGLGERLGYPYPKIGLDFDLVSETSKIRYMLETSLVWQQRANDMTGQKQGDFWVIQTSPDNHDMTMDLLNPLVDELSETFGPIEMRVIRDRSELPDPNVNPGMHQIFVVTQDLVPAMVDRQAHFAIDSKNPYRVEQKPHGHGDIHKLFYELGLAEYSVARGKTHTFTLQDTSAHAMNGLLAVNAEIRRSGAGMILTAVGRAVGENIGGLVELVDSTTGQRTVQNVEYNYLRAPGVDMPDPDSGQSRFSGNVNVLGFANVTYVPALVAHQGRVIEFANPKTGKDPTGQRFDSSARIESMKQDAALWPEIGSTAVVTFSDKRLIFSVGKNELAKKNDTVANEETAQLRNSRLKLAHAGVEIPIDGPTRLAALGAPYEGGAKVVLGPRFAPTLSELRSHIKGPVRVSGRSVLHWDGDVDLDNVTVDGALIVLAAPGVHVTVRGLTVDDFTDPAAEAAWEYVALTQEELKPESPLPPSWKARGYRPGEVDRIKREAQYARVYEITEPGDWEIGSDGQLVKLAESGDLGARAPQERVQSVAKVPLPQIGTLRLTVREAADQDVLVEVFADEDGRWQARLQLGDDPASAQTTHFNADGMAEFQVGGEWPVTIRLILDAKHTRKVHVLSSNPKANLTFAVLPPPNERLNQGNAPTLTSSQMARRDRDIPNLLAAHPVTRLQNGYARSAIGAFLNAETTLNDAWIALQAVPQVGWSIRVTIPQWRALLVAVGIIVRSAGSDNEPAGFSSEEALVLVLDAVLERAGPNKESMVMESVAGFTPDQLEAFWSAVDRASGVSNDSHVTDLNPPIWPQPYSGAISGAGTRDLHLVSDQPLKVEQKLPSLLTAPQRDRAAALVEIVNGQFDEAARVIASGYLVNELETEKATEALQGRTREPIERARTRLIIYGILTLSAGTPNEPQGISTRLADIIDQLIDVISGQAEQSQTDAEALGLSLDQWSVLVQSVQDQVSARSFSDLRPPQWPQPMMGGGGGSSNRKKITLRLSDEILTINVSYTSMGFPESFETSTGQSGTLQGVSSVTIQAPDSFGEVSLRKQTATYIVAEAGNSLVKISSEGTYGGAGGGQWTLTSDQTERLKNLKAGLEQEGRTPKILTQLKRMLEGDAFFGPAIDGDKFIERYLIVTMVVIVLSAGSEQEPDVLREAKPSQLVSIANTAFQDYKNGNTDGLRSLGFSPEHAQDLIQAVTDSIDDPHLENQDMSITDVILPNWLISKRVQKSQLNQSIELPAEDQITWTLYNPVSGKSFAVTISRQDSAVRARIQAERETDITLNEGQPTTLRGDLVLTLTGSILTTDEPWAFLSDVQREIGKLEGSGGTGPGGDLKTPALMTDEQSQRALRITDLLPGLDQYLATWLPFFLTGQMQAWPEENTQSFYQNFLTNPNPGAEQLEALGPGARRRVLLVLKVLVASRTDNEPAWIAENFNEVMSILLQYAIEDTKEGTSPELLLNTTAERTFVALEQLTGAGLVSQTTVTQQINSLLSAVRRAWAAPADDLIWQSNLAPDWSTQALLEFAGAGGGGSRNRVDMLLQLVEDDTLRKQIEPYLRGRVRSFDFTVQGMPGLHPLAIIASIDPRKVRAIASKF